MSNAIANAAAAALAGAALLTAGAAQAQSSYPGPGSPGSRSQCPIPTRCSVWYVLPSVLIDGATTSSAFWNSRIDA